MSAEASKGHHLLSGMLLTDGIALLSNGLEQRVRQRRPGGQIIRQRSRSRIDIDGRRFVLSGLKHRLELSMTQPIRDERSVVSIHEGISLYGTTVWTTDR